MNIQLAIQHGTNILTDKRINTAKLDAEILMAKTLKKDRKFIILNNNKDLEDKNLKYFNELIKERASYKPIAHLINKKFFWNNEFFVNKNTLIPRPDTEVIVEQVLELTKHKDLMNILDIGVGSGDRSERIRTYNFPQGRVTDHRINLTLHRLEEFLEGEAFDEMIESLTLQAQEDSLSNLK